MKSRESILTCLTVILVLSGFAYADLIVHLTNDTQVELSCVEIIYYGSTNDLIDAPISSSITNSTDHVNGNIFLVRSALAVDRTVLEVQNTGAQAVIYISPVFNVAGFLSYRRDSRDTVQQIRIPVFEVPAEHGRILWQLWLTEQIQNITILPGDGTNEWVNAYKSDFSYVRIALIVSFTLVNIGLAVWKIVLFVRFYGGARWSIALVVLTLEIISNALRLASVLDGVFIYTEQTGVALAEICFPISISSYMLFILYWHEMMTNASLVVHPFITKMRIPFFVLSSALILLHLLRIILRNVTLIDNLSLFTAILYMVITLALVIFYFITGIKLLKRLHVSKSMGRTVRLRKTTVKILISGGFLLAFLIIAILFVTGLPYRPIPFIAVWFVLYMMLNATSLLNILAFELPAGASSKATKTSSNQIDMSDTRHPIGN